MRTKEFLMDNLGKYGERTDEKMAKALRVIAEALLDIRDLLSKDAKE